jgi:hypothetical protein
MAAHTEIFRPLPLATTILADSPLLARPNLRRRCRLKPHSSTHTIFRWSNGDSSRNLRAYCLRPWTTSGQFLETGIARSNLSVNPILVSALETVFSVTVTCSSAANLLLREHKVRSGQVRSGRSSIHSESVSSIACVILMFRLPPLGSKVEDPLISIRRTIACAVLVAIPNAAAAELIDSCACEWM